MMSPMYPSAIAGWNGTLMNNLRDFLMVVFGDPVG